MGVVSRLVLRRKNTRHPRFMLCSRLYLYNNMQHKTVKYMFNYFDINDQILCTETLEKT